MKYYIIEDDLVIAEVSSGGISYDGDLPPDDIRFKDSEFVDVRKYEEFYIDGFGRKHILPKESWQKLSCRLHDDLFRFNNQWIVKTEDEKLKEFKQEYLIIINKTAKEYQEKLVPADLVEEYRRKELAAKAYKGGSATDVDKAILNIEAEALNISTEKHVEAILAKVEALDYVWAQIVDFRSSTKAAVLKASSVEEIEAILEKSKIEAQKAFEKLGA